MRLLVIDDDAEVRDLLVRALRRDGHVVAAVATAAAARQALAMGEAEVVVIDLGLPDGSGTELCREVRAARRDVAVLMLTARSEIAIRVRALDAGADDFLGKPFAIAELRARVRALGRRRARGSAAPELAHDGASIDLGARRASRGGASISLTAREWAILEALAARAGRMVPRTELLEETWGEASEASSSSLEVLIGRIRRKLGDRIIRTIRGEGYSLGWS